MKFVPTLFYFPPYLFYSDYTILPVRFVEYIEPGIRV